MTRQPKRAWWVRAWLALLILACSQTLWAQQQAPDFTAKIADLTTSSFSKRAKAIEAVVALDDERVLPVLEALLEGDLYYRKSDDRT